MQTDIPLLESTPLLLILLGTVFVHACFQLSVSVLTLLSSHTIGRQLPNKRLLNLNFWYIFGVGSAISMLLLAVISFERLLMSVNAPLATMLPLSIAPLVSLFIIATYYRRGRGTKLWLPRSAAEYITTRAKKTHSSVEAFALGITTALTELPFALAPLAISAYVLHGYGSEKWLAFAMSYALAVVLPLVFVAFYISSGHKISHVQRWREESKQFLKWTAAITLILIAFYISTLQRGSVV